MFVENFALSKVTSLGVGGPADLFISAQSADDVAQAQRFALEKGLPLTVIGYGTNLLVRDGGIRGVVVQIAESLSSAQVQGTSITAQAGCLLGSLAKLALHHGLTGLEFAVGIPGGLGGATFMNAGAYGGEIGPLIEKVEFVQGGRLQSWNRDEFYFAYRSSRLQHEAKDAIVTAVELRLEPGSKETIFQTMNGFQEQRRSKQPLEYPSAGSTFKRPPGHYVGPLIEQAGLKGMRVGGAEVSMKHAGFLVKKDEARSRDFLDLIRQIQETILEEFGIALEPEIRILGED
ncbi:MAG: UDP-N-acetylmuramate dehydrogenase [Firmicutes bacterium]|nr:UDP-N-acetylmuramate dehydrogenase [Bacillota bacterium]